MDNENNMVGTYHKLKEFYDSPYDEYRQYNGEPFTIVGMQWKNTDDENGENCEALFKIRFKNGIEIFAWTEEVFENWLMN